MSEVVPIYHSEKKAVEQERKERNDEIIYELYKQGKTKYNPYEEEYSEGYVIHVPEACFVTKKFYRVGD